MGRHYVAMAREGAKYSAVVVGGGPAGITIVGNLLEQRLPGRVLWVDPLFKAGRVNAKYREVPSNTAVKLFIQFAEAVKPFRDVIKSTPEPNAVSVLRQMRQDKGCELSRAADMNLMLTEGLSKTDGVQQTLGYVSAAVFNEQANHWTVALDQGQIPVTTSRLILCTGSSPISFPLPIQERMHDLNLESVDLDTCLAPSLLPKALSPSATVAVIGASHSAILVLRNLYNLARDSHPQLRIKWFTRNPLRYAVPMDGWILRDNTGLKGEAADWARENLEDNEFANSPVSKYIQKVSMTKGDEDSVYEKELPGCTHIVQAVGYKRDPIPKLSIRDGVAGEEPLSAWVPGLFGAGIAYPERVTDPYGNVEYAVGFWKFMRFAKRVVPEWVQGP
ncbi:uncharacterized protein K452DRAFT_330183 [Aplosporella prunicola CBS 121167]|uniref:FAD/NAD(P)-binding domain-containing protein n=1 Tax=Aplosporella prunicola CBS 121167 TaxID=1176127 RepID=A0A6A6AY85_9PEZI|nr:uncharacterized protein K452DRAFT_330183 [Aplosporella prunicola CBS 121167]KAF2135501.1 hypothetical protein K452DRAFT_330183 [Aplosporella prunicola CBS 121167]